MEEDMSFMIGPNETGLRVYNHVNTHQIAQANQLARVASGKEASGGGAGVGSLSLLADRSAFVDGTRSDLRNAQTALGQLMVADAALTEMAAIAQNGLEAASKGGYVSEIGEAFVTAISEINVNAQFQGGLAIEAFTATVGAAANMNFGPAARDYTTDTAGLIADVDAVVASDFDNALCYRAGPGYGCGWYPAGSRHHPVTQRHTHQRAGLRVSGREQRPGC